jgi:uncharacterized membrane protein
MEVCILTFTDTHYADDALEKALDVVGGQLPWLHEVGVVKRPLIGKISIRATFDDDKPTELKQGDLASQAADTGALTGYLIGSLVGPLHADMAAMEGEQRARAAAKRAENELMFVDEIKQALPRGTSALVLVAPKEINDDFVALFSDYTIEIDRRDLAEEIEQRLHKFADKVRAAFPQASP